MTKPILLAVIALAAAPAAATPDVHLAQGDRGPIAYTREARADGAMLLTSVPGARGAAFRLVVRNGWVSGDVDGRSVSFRAPRQRGVRAD